MKWFLVIVVLFAVVFIGRYGLYRLCSSRGWRWNGDLISRPKGITCFYGLHSWYTDSAMFSSASRCNYCDAAEDEDDLRRLEYERELWENEARTPGFSSEASQTRIALKMSAWDINTAYERSRSAD